MLLLLTDFRLYLLLGAAFVAGYARTADDRPERDGGRHNRGRLGAAADVLFLAAFPLLGVLFWRHGLLAGAASLLGAWAVALIGDGAYQRRHAPPRARPPGRPHSFHRFGQATRLPPAGVCRPAGRVAPQFPAAQLPRHVRYRRPAPARRAPAPRH